MGERDKGSNRPRILVLGASGLNGGAIAAQLGERGRRRGSSAARVIHGPLANWKGRRARLPSSSTWTIRRAFPAALEGDRPPVPDDGLHHPHGPSDEDDHQMRRWTPASASSSILACFGNGRLDRSAFRLARASSNATSRGSERGLVSPPSACLHGKPADGHAPCGWRVALANGRQARGLGRQRRYCRCSS